MSYINKQLKNAKMCMIFNIIAIGFVVLQLTKAYETVVLAFTLPLLFLGVLSSLKNIKFYKECLDMSEVEEDICVQKIEYIHKKGDVNCATFLYSSDSREFFLEESCDCKVIDDDEKEDLQMIVNTDAEYISENDSNDYLAELDSKVVSGDRCRIRYIKTSRWNLITDIEKIHNFN